MPVIETAVAARRTSTRRVPVRRLAHVRDAINAICTASDAGACTCYIRNTVADAVRTYRELRLRGYQPILFHARMAMVDRLAVERQVLELFGKSSTPEQRRGKIVISTQTIEQSLDVDFDLLVTDLCPIDLLIQRAGRLGRHQRDGRPVGLEMLIVSPEPIENAAAGWYREMFPAGVFVYQSAALLWLSAKVVFDAGCIDTPSGVRPMVEAVYGADARGNVPIDLQDDFDRARDRAFGQTSQADDNLLRVSDGYQPGHRGWAQDVHTPTRLGEPTRAFRLACWDGATLTPYAGGSGFSAWLLSEVSIARRKALRRDAYEDAALEDAARKLEKEWDDDSIVLVVDADGAGEIVVLGERRAEIRRYSRETGLS